METQVTLTQTGGRSRVGLWLYEV